MLAKLDALRPGKRCLSSQRPSHPGLVRCSEKELVDKIGNQLGNVRCKSEGARAVEGRLSALLIRINRLYRRDMTPVELYGATRGTWKLGERRRGARYAFAVFEGSGLRGVRDRRVAPSPALRRMTRVTRSRAQTRVPVPCHIGPAHRHHPARPAGRLRAIPLVVCSV